MSDSLLHTSAMRLYIGKEISNTFAHKYVCGPTKVTFYKRLISLSLLARENRWKLGQMSPQLGLFCFETILAKPWREEGEPLAILTL